MFNIFNSKVFVGIGEAIGSVGDKVFRRRSAVDMVDEAFQRHLKETRSIRIPISQDLPIQPEEDIIDVPFVVLPLDEEERIR